MTTTTTKSKRRRKTTANNKPNYAAVTAGDEPSFFARALTIKGRFTLAWILLCAAVRILIKGRALV